MKKILLLAWATVAFSVPVAVSAQTQEPSTSLPGRGIAGYSPPHPGTPFQSPQAMHAEFLRRFQSSPGFGFSRMLLPEFLAPAPALVWNKTTYPVTPPLLIGLEDDPIAYPPREYHRNYSLGTNQSRAEVRKKFVHRPLTALETNAVLALRDGGDVVILPDRVVAPESQFTRLDTTPSLLVVGALRAGRDCAACHQCKEGTLLGAFAYSLTPLPPPTPYAPPAAPKRVAEGWISAPDLSWIAGNSGPTFQRW